jgi:hypothetical protein
VAALTELKGKELGSTKVRVERGPVQAFARAVTDDPAKYADADAIVPPTFPFSWSYWGTVDGKTEGLPINDLRGPGRMILHGEQEFEWHRPPRVGDLLEGTARISDVYEKATSSALMEFYVMETSWTDAASGDPVVDARFTLIIRDTSAKSTQ